MNIQINKYLKANGANQPAIVLAGLFAAAAAYCVWLGHDTGGRGFYWVAGFLAIIASLIPQSIMIADQWERAVVLRLGKLTAVRGPGLFAIVPFIDTVASWLDQRIQTTEINAEQALSKDTVPVNIDAVVFWQIHDPERAALEIANYRQAITQVAQTSLREVVGSSLLSTLLSDRKQGDQQLREEIGRKIADWGIAVLSVEIRDIGVPPALQDAMSRQAQAEREKLARVLLSQAEQEIAQKFVEAADIYARSPAALQLRAMNIIYETTKERGLHDPDPDGDGRQPQPCGRAGRGRGGGRVARQRQFVGRGTPTPRRAKTCPTSASRARGGWRRRGYRASWRVP
jgi:regulator of protease activity HflC (stomatin/prohibitin superfamily)